MAESPGNMARVRGESIPAAVWALPLTALGAAVAILLGFIVLGSSATSSPDTGSPYPGFLLIATVPLALIVCGLVTVRRPQTPACALLFACIVFNQSIEHLYLPVLGFRIYPQDILLAAALFVAIVRIRSAAPVQSMPTALGKWMVVAFVVATIQTFRGLALGNEWNAAFGDWRRGYFYMIVFFLVLAESSDPRRCLWFHRTFVLAAIVIACRGIYHLTFGRLFQLSWFDVFHVLGHNDLVFVTFLAYYCLARVAFPVAGQRRWPWLVAIPVTLVLIVLGNFRACWIGFFLAGIVCATLLPREKRRVLIPTAMVVLLCSAVGLYAARNVRVGTFGETIQEGFAGKFKNMLEWETDPNIVWRFHSYRAAWSIWSDHPVLGAGLGRRLVFHSIIASGEQTVHFNHRAHNSLLWVGFTQGAFGLLIFLFLHATYFFGVARRIRAAGGRQETGVLLAYLAFYVAFMTVALFDVILEESATAIVLYAHMAIVFRLSETAARRKTEETNGEPSAAVGTT